MAWGVFLLCVIYSFSAHLIIMEEMCNPRYVNLSTPVTCFPPVTVFKRFDVQGLYNEQLKPFRNR